MVKDALQACVHLASGLSRTTRERAAAAARALIGHAGLEEVASEAQDRVSRLADEIVGASKANTQLLTSFVTHEVDQAVDRLGLVRRSDLDHLRTEIADLRAAVAHRVTRDDGAAAGRSAASAEFPSTTRARAARKAAAKTPGAAAKTAGSAAKTAGSAAKTARSAAKAPSAKAATAAPAKRTTTRKATKKAATGAGAAASPITDPGLEETSRGRAAATATGVGPFEPEPLPVPAPIPPAGPEEGVGGARPEDQ